MSNPYAEAMIGFANDQLKLKKPYVFGKRGPNAFDCMGLMYAAARAAGLGPDVFPNSWTVRNLVGVARKNGWLHLADSGYAPERGDLGIWGPVGGGQPEKGAGHVLLVKRPATAAKPKGKAISAFNPEKDIINHGVAPKPGGHLALYAYIALPYPQPEVPVEIEDSAPPSESVEQPDAEPVPSPEPSVPDVLADIQSVIDKYAP